MSRTVTIEPLSRIEGYGRVVLETEGDRLVEVRFDVLEGIRLLEGLIQGRPWTDVPAITSRICAICSAAHAVTAVEAIEDAFGIVIPPGARELRNLLLRGESIESHALHLFFLAAPDYAAVPDAISLAPEHEAAVRAGLRLKRLGNRIQEVVGGRAIHPVNVVPGGFAQPPDRDELISLHLELEAVRGDVERGLEFLSALPAPGFTAGDTRLAALVPPSPEQYFTGRAIRVQGKDEGVTTPLRDYASLLGERAVPHSHAKESFPGDKPVMVGALARLGLRSATLPPPARETADRLGLRFPCYDPLANNLAQAVELASDVEQALSCVGRLLEEGDFPASPEPVVPFAGRGVAATEAPRGLLVYSFEFDERGRVRHADVVTPTAINAASVEKALRTVAESHAGGGDPELRSKLERVVRAYDPCISCSVH